MTMERLDLPDEAYFAAIKELVDEGRTVSMKPKGNSMLPFIRSGKDAVSVSPVSRELEVGDIVLVRTGGRFILHRIFAIDGDAITLMGDGNLKGKEHCLKSEVYGIITEIQREGGKSFKPGKGRVWRALLPLRRYILFIYRRLFPSHVADLRGQSSEGK